MRLYNSTDHVLIDMAGKVPKPVKDMYLQEYNVAWLYSFILTIISGISGLVATLLALFSHWLPAVVLVLTILVLLAIRSKVNKRKNQYLLVVTAYYLVKDTGYKIEGSN